MTHSDPERSAPPAFAQNENWLDKAIADARKEGAFDNLPNTGKPLKLDEISVDSEYDLAFTMLKNAGVSPYWMEMQKDTDAFQQRMAVLIKRTRAFLADEIAREHDAPKAPPRPAPKRRGWWSKLFGSEDLESTPERARFDRATLVRTRQAARDQYLEIAAELDAHLVKYHQSLPSNLWHLQRYRKSPEEFAAEFDSAIPDVDDLFNQKVLDAAPAGS
ncbi:MAG: DUF1992 domain-containing protein [Thermomicrobiales bacterium]